MISRWGRILHQDKNNKTLKENIGISLRVQWFRLCASNAGYVGFGQGIKILPAARCGQKKKRIKLNKIKKKENADAVNCIKEDFKWQKIRYLMWKDHICAGLQNTGYKP